MLIMRNIWLKQCSKDEGMCKPRFLKINVLILITKQRIDH